MFFCKCEKRIACIIIATSLLITGIHFALKEIWTLPQILPKESATVKVFAITLLLISLIEVAVSGCLLKGCLDSQRKLLYPWLIFNAIFAIPWATISLIILAFSHAAASSVIILAIIIVIVLYLFSIVWLFQKELALAEQNETAEATTQQPAMLA